MGKSRAGDIKNYIRYSSWEKSISIFQWYFQGLRRIGLYFILCFLSLETKYFWKNSWFWCSSLLIFQEHREDCEFVNVICEKGCGSTLLKYQLESHICVDPTTPSLQQELALCNSAFMENGEFVDVSRVLNLITLWRVKYLVIKGDKISYLTTHGWFLCVQM